MVSAGASSAAARAEAEAAHRAALWAAAARAAKVPAARFALEAANIAARYANKKWMKELGKKALRMGMKTEKEALKKLPSQLAKDGLDQGHKKTIRKKIWQKQHSMSPGDLLA